MTVKLTDCFGTVYEYKDVFQIVNFPKSDSLIIKTAKGEFVISKQHIKLTIEKFEVEL